MDIYLPDDFYAIRDYAETHAPDPGALWLGGEAFIPTATTRTERDDEARRADPLWQVV